MKFITLIVFLQITSIILLPSEDICNKVFQYIKENKTVYYPTHFIFDEYNYTGLDIYDDKMIDLYNSQELIFQFYNVSTYIFAIKYINESIEPLDEFRNSFRTCLRNNSMYLNESIFTFISIESNDGRIYTGANTKKRYISNGTALVIKKNY